jgi:putative intracellular protease/amidase
LAGTQRFGDFPSQTVNAEPFSSQVVHSPIPSQAVDVQPFVKAFLDAGKPIAAICHGPWTIIEAGAARGRRIASWPSLKTDLKNAGAEWVDEEAVVDGNLVTSRNPKDIPAFNRAAIEVFSTAQTKTKRAAN